MGNCLADAVIGATATIVFVHGSDNLVGCGRRIAIDKGRCRHDLTTHAPATLRHLQVEEGLLDGVEFAIGIGKPFDGTNLFADHAIDGRLA